MKNIIKKSLLFIACLGLYHTNLFCDHLYLTAVKDSYYKEWDKVSSEIYDANRNHCSSQKDNNDLMINRHMRYMHLKKCLVENVDNQL